MGSHSNQYVPTKLTRAFRDWQDNEQFRGWVAMHEALMEIEFPLDNPEVEPVMFAKESLPIIEQKLLDLYPDAKTALSRENWDSTMRFIFYIGEVYRRAFEGSRWAVLPPNDQRPAPKSVIDVPFREDFIDPIDQVGFIYARRSGKELGRIYGYAERDYDEWVSAGRPEPEYLGVLREQQ